MNSGALSRIGNMILIDDDIKEIIEDLAGEELASTESTYLVSYLERHVAARRLVVGSAIREVETCMLQGFLNETRALLAV